MHKLKLPRPFRFKGARPEYISQSESSNLPPALPSPSETKDKLGFQTLETPIWQNFPPGFIQLALPPGGRLGSRPEIRLQNLFQGGMRHHLMAIHGMSHDFSNLQKTDLPIHERFDGHFIRRVQH